MGLSRADSKNTQGIFGPHSQNGVKGETNGGTIGRRGGEALKATEWCSALILSVQGASLGVRAGLGCNLT